MVSRIDRVSNGIGWVVDQKSALRDIPWDMLMLFVGALALGTALTIPEQAI